MQSPTVDDLARMVGHRVVVRYRLHARSEVQSGPGATDVLGILEQADDTTVLVHTADEQQVKVAVADIVAARVIPIRAVPRRDVRDLEAAALLGWQAAEVVRYGGWLLRASHGFTGRGNSVLPLAAPGGPLDEAIAHVEDWYGTRGLRPAFQVVELLGADVTEALDRRGWPPLTDRTVVMTAPLATLPEPTGVQVRIDDHPDDAWLAGYHYRGGTLPSTARQIIAGTGSTGPVTLAFASVRVDDSGTTAVQAIARGAVTASPAGRVWLGVTALEVAAKHRRRGLATTVLAALTSWARDHGATDTYVQVATENTAAQQMYAALGFTAHHHYHYRVAGPSR